MGEKMASANGKPGLGGGRRGDSAQEPLGVTKTHRQQHAIGTLIWRFPIFHSTPPCPPLSSRSLYAFRNSTDMRMRNSRSHETVNRHVLGNGSPPPASGKSFKHTSEVRSNRCGNSPSPETSNFSPEDLLYSLNRLQRGTPSESRKSVRFSEQIGCIQIPCVDAREGLVKRISGRLKSLCNPRGSSPILGNEPGVHVSSLLCLPKIGRRRQSFGSIEVAVWNSGRQLRQVVASPTLFKRLSDFPSNLLRDHERFSFDKWRSQPSLESPYHKHNKGIELPLQSHFDRMESVYVSDLDEDYEWGSTPSEWEGYETPLFIPARKAKVTPVNPCK
ncbi:hypothetical protein TcWFU_002858 [Taenia crassiceps]|uniref:Uncharacterized protein n=1 Tax=Taenia crassiceps TaxID=6207 RepID=A0ABR4QRC9_9CEST